MSAYGLSSSQKVGRLFVIFAVLAITLTVIGMIDLSKDAFGSFSNFTDLPKNGFREGDIVQGNITETLGCAGTVETTEYAFHFIETGKYTSSYYFVLPFYTEDSGAFPDRIVLFRTSNENQAETLNDLAYETLYWYTGQNSYTYSHLKIDRAEVKSMSSEENRVFREYLDRFIEAYYSGASNSEITDIKTTYYAAIVPYVVQYSPGGGSGLLTVGLVMIGIIVVGVVIYIAGGRNTSSVPQVTYVGSNVPRSDPNLDSPTGLKNASEAFYRKADAAKGAAAGLPQQVKPVARQANGLRDYSNSERPLPPIEGIKTEKRVIRYDPQTGKAIFGDVPIDPTSISKAAKNVPSIKPTGDTMPTVDPDSEQNVDISNGGRLPEEKTGTRGVMPMNGDIPVMNPDAAPSAYETPEPMQFAEDVTPIHPPTREDNMKHDFQVEQTDPTLRNIYSHISGGEMNAVDPYTEKNVDVSNGGIELPEQDDLSGTRRDVLQFPTPEPLPSPASMSAPAFTPSPEPVFSEIRTDFPEPPAPIAPAAPEPAPKKEEPESYNIFKTDSSYNIFKTNDTPLSDTSKDKDFGFPVENKEFPKVDTSFPTAGESDVGGKDDFIF